MMNSTLDVVSATVSRESKRTQPTSPTEPARTCPICGGHEVADRLAAPDRFHLRTEMYTLTRCNACHAVWQMHPPPPAEMGAHYTPEYHQAIVTAGEGSAMARWKPQVDLISRYKSGGAILDIGCSSGGFLSTMNNRNWELYGIEMEESTAEKAKAATGARVFVGDAMDAPFLPGSFDVITCFDVLEHVYHPREFLTKVQQWLKPGGIYYAMMPNIDSWEARLFGSYWFGLEMPRHITHFSPHSLRHLMTGMGFEEAEIKTPPTSYIERSARYVGSNLGAKLGITPTPQSQPKSLSLPLRIVRKGLRMTVIAPVAHVASMAGAGPSMEAVFRKASC